MSYPTSPITDRALFKHASNALFVQGAVNLSGVVASMSTAMQELWSAARLEGGTANTSDVNKHPIAYLFAVQVGFLSGASPIGDGPYHEAVAECERIAASAKAQIAKESSDVAA